AIKLRRWFDKTKSDFEISKYAEGKKVKFAAATLNRKLEMQGFWKENCKSGRAFKVEIEVVREIKGITLVILFRIAKSKEMSELSLPLLLMESFLCVNDVLLAMLASVRSSVTSVERFGIRQGIARRRVLPRGLMLSLSGVVMIVVSKVILGMDVQRRISKRKLEKFVAEVMLLRMLSLKRDAVIIYGEKVVHIPYGNEMLIVKSDKGVLRLKKQMEDVLVIRDFLEVFPEELPGLPPPSQVEF
nr:hypothetical protein [Tanacetum cinerariifolium]